jgi:putative DNA primase/helicase
MQQQAINIEEPNWLEPIFEDIPDELRQQPWAVWKAEPRLDEDRNHTGKWSKAPRNPLTGRMIGANQPDKFGTFLEAKKAYESGNYTGVGVVLTGSGIVGIDIDDVKNLFKITPQIREWLFEASKAGAYIETSPTGKGFRIFLRGAINSKRRKHDLLEIYENERFLTVTGHQIN